MKKLVKLIAEKLVDDPEKIEVNEEIDGDLIKIQLKVADNDMGKVIGKQGKIAKAIRTVTTAAATKKNQKVVIKITQ